MAWLLALRSGHADVPGWLQLQLSGSSESRLGELIEEVEQYVCGTRREGPSHLNEADLFPHVLWPIQEVDSV